MMAEQNTGTGNSQVDCGGLQQAGPRLNCADCAYAETQTASVDLAYICEQCNRQVYSWTTFAAKRAPDPGASSWYDTSGSAGCSREVESWNSAPLQADITTELTSRGYWGFL